MKSIQVGNQLSPIIESHNLFVVIINAKVRVIIPDKEIKDKLYDCMIICCNMMFCITARIGSFVPAYSSHRFPRHRQTCHTWQQNVLQSFCQTCHTWQHIFQIYSSFESMKTFSSLINFINPKADLLLSGLLVFKHLIRSVYFQKLLMRILKI